MKKIDRELANALANLAEDLDAAQMMIDGKIAGDARETVNEAGARFQRYCPRALVAHVVELGKIRCHVNIDGKVHYIKSISR
jgi:hypothetical protein